MWFFSIQKQGKNSFFATILFIFYAQIKKIIKDNNTYMLLFFLSKFSKLILIGL